MFVTPQLRKAIKHIFENKCLILLGSFPSWRTRVIVKINTTAAFTPRRSESFCKIADGSLYRELNISWLNCWCGPVNAGFNKVRTPWSGCILNKWVLWILNIRSHSENCGGCNLRLAEMIHSRIFAYIKTHNLNQYKIFDQFIKGACYLRIILIVKIY